MLVDMAAFSLPDSAIMFKRIYSACRDVRISGTVPCAVEADGLFQLRSVGLTLRNLPAEGIMAPKIDSRDCYIRVCRKI